MSMPQLRPRLHKHSTQGGTDAIALQVDVADRSSVDRACDDVRSRLGPIEILVTCAAVSGFVAFGALDVGHVDRTIAVNLTGTFHCMQAAIPDMIARSWGRIVTVSCSRRTDGLTTPGRLTPRRRRRDRADEVCSTRVRKPRNHCRHGAAVRRRGDAARRAGVEASAERQGIAGFVPAGRLGRAEEVAAVRTFLCSEEAATSRVRSWA